MVTKNHNLGELSMKRRALITIATLTVIAAGCSSNTDDGAPADATASTTAESTASAPATENADEAPTTTADTASETTSPAATPDTDEGTSSGDNTGDATIDATEDAGTDPAADPPAGAAPSGIASTYLGDYTLTDTEFGTEVTVTVTNGQRTISANALPNHETGEFPNAGNPNAISAQDAEWIFPTDQVLTETATSVLTPGVAVNGVKFEPGTAERTECSTGEVYRVEALQDLYDLGLDMNNAHVQPGGEYHYHGVSPLLVDAFDGDSDLVHVGFAADGHLMVYSLSGAYPSGYSLSATARTGTDCQPSLRGSSVIDLDGTTPDGTYTSDWVHTAGPGVLDECNGIEIDGVYTYVITNEYPYISRCLMGSFTETQPGPGGPAAMASTDGAGDMPPPPGNGPMPPPPSAQG